MVALSPTTCQVLRDHLNSEIALCIKLNILFNNDRLIFCQIDGSPLRPDTITQSWHRMTRKAGLNNVRFHALRHTHASLMLKQGVHPKIVQERLGHSTIAVTLDTSSHVAPGLQRAAANNLDEILNPRITKRLAETVLRD